MGNEFITGKHWFCPSGRKSKPWFLHNVPFVSAAVRAYTDTELSCQSADMS
jgi:hypothetical protein